MGDYYTYILPVEVKKKDAEQVAARVIDFLMNNKIVEPQLTDCVYGKDGGYAAGENCASILNGYDEALSPLTYKINGVEVRSEKETYDTGEISDVTCPECGESVVDPEEGEDLENWLTENTDNEIVCPSCQYAASVSECTIEIGEDVSEVGLVFWNWGDNFKDSFLKNLENLTGSRIVVTIGKL